MEKKNDRVQFQNEFTNCLRLINIRLTLSRFSFDIQSLIECALHMVKGEHICDTGKIARRN